MSDQRLDIVIVGGGAAGLATAIFARRNSPELSVAILDGAAKLGAKILVSGGGRCNVTNVKVTTADFQGGSRHIIKRILAEFPAEDALEFFREIGVNLHEEPNGKLFPDSNSARTVLNALVAEAQRLGVSILTDCRVQSIEKSPLGFTLQTPSRFLAAPKVVLATGGLSLPKTGSDGGGYALARSLGHSIVPTTPALAPLILEGQFHAALSGISQDVELVLHVEGEPVTRLKGSLLWTHFGISGPVVLDISRFWHSARINGRRAELGINFLPDIDFAACEQRLIDTGTRQPTSAVRSILAGILPARVAEAMLNHLGISPTVQMAHLTRDDRRKLVHGLLKWPVVVKDSRGYAYAEVTAGGVPLDEINSASMESRQCPGLFLVGEILDVDGRIGGFNFQWAWSTGFVAGRGLAPFLSR
jgi:predicted Rossmann fold flavoprotein